ncbi:cell wall hydrolase [Bacillus aquiflavi]|uniref:Cell wall hydrolase n=1 Tax=Bacillus aquiflavi TaxID=2672567 RepID=A0A6B3W6L6_9BACI|nr:cell wall hydrolase [Bacillus aquiflavi]NEY83054.1 LysM peptidoglycan-binding domain-containing protein [Bacillus aquiflavi]
MEIIKVWRCFRNSVRLVHDQFLFRRRKFIVKKIIFFSAILLVFTIISQIKYINTNAQTVEGTKFYTVQKGDSLYRIGVKFGVPVNKLRDVNFIKTENVSPGDKLIIPDSITDSEKELLARLVHAEAKGEPYAGKVAVATVVLNRVESKLFPNTIKDVIYQKRQFEPVANGTINEHADEDSKKAVMEALALKGSGKGSLYFFNPDKTSNKWLRSKEVTTVIGKHRFAK